ncbi:DUF397 domain-containing protein [Streptomyces mirabilis]
MFVHATRLTSHDYAPVRDSRNPTGPILTIAPAAFATFVSWTTTAG